MYEDGEMEDDPTCGIQYDKNGNRIRYGSGFCCKCDVSELLEVSD